MMTGNLYSLLGFAEGRVGQTDNHHARELRCDRCFHLDEVSIETVQCDRKGFEGSHRDIMIALSDLQDNQYVINEDLIRNLWSKIEKDEVDFEKLDLMSSIIRVKRTPEDVMMGMLSQVGSEWDIERSVGLSKAKGLTPRALEKYYFSKLADSENSLQWLLNNPNLTAKILDHIVYDKPERFKTDNFKYRAKKHRNFKPRPKESPMKKASSFFSKFF